VQPQNKILGLFFGVLLPYIALVMYFARRNHGRPEGQPLPTWLLYLGMACILAIIVVSRRIVRSANAKSTDKKQDSRSERKPIRTIWCVVNISLIALGVRQGYASLAPEQLRHVNPDAVFCSLILLTAPLFALLTVHYSVRRCNVDKLRRPSLDRNPLNWWFDPLQSLFISTCSVAAMAVGSLLHRPTGSVAFWMVATYFCITLGLVVGQVVVYRVYQDRVVAAH
jgi:FtsH-binding integral membrane protein